MKKNYKSILILVTLLIILIFYIIYTDKLVANFLEYTEVFINKILPVSFTFFTISNLLIEYNFLQIIQKIFKINSSYLYILLLSLISGFPSGAIYTKELLKKNIIDLNDANKIIMFSHFPNPLFILNSVLLITNNKSITYIILISLILSNIIIFLFLNNNKNKITSPINYPKDFSNSLVKCILKSTKTIIIIYGTSIFFYLISALINNFNNIYIYTFINGIFDLTKGVYSTTLINNIILKSIFIISFISFGSLSIQLQIKSILSDTPIKYQNYIYGRIIGLILSLTIFIILLTLSNWKIKSICSTSNTSYKIYWTYYINSVPIT